MRSSSISTVDFHLAVDNMDRPNSTPTVYKEFHYKFTPKNQRIKNLRSKPKRRRPYILWLTWARRRPRNPAKKITAKLTSTWTEWKLSGRSRRKRWMSFSRYYGEYTWRHGRLRKLTAVLMNESYRLRRGNGVSVLAWEPHWMVTAFETESSME